jgi:hypothetical protein
MKNRYLVVYIVCLIVLSFAFIYGCGSNPTGGGGGSANRVYYGTQTPGDSWKWEMGSSTFSEQMKQTAFG